MLLSNIISFTIHLDVHTKITIWIIILLGILIFLGNTNIFIAHLEIQTELTNSWIVITHSSQDLETSISLFLWRLTNWIWVISEGNFVTSLHEGILIRLTYMTKATMGSNIFVSIIVWNNKVWIYCEIWLIIEVRFEISRSFGSSILSDLEWRLCTARLFIDV